MRRQTMRCLAPLMAAWAACGPMGARAEDAEGGARVRPRELLAAMTGDAAGRTTLYAAAATALRERGADRPGEAVAFFFAREAAEDWQASVVQDMQMGDQVLADFFTGAMLLSGPQSPKAGIAGLYNPWWDAILLLRMEPVEGHPALRDGEPAVLVRDFLLLSGETFRGEPGEASAEAVRRTTVVPERDPLSAEVWRVTAGTVACFERDLPLEGRVSWSRCAGGGLLSLDREREARRLAVRAGLRLKLSLALLKDARALSVGMHVLRMAKTGSLYQLYQSFRDPGSRVLLASFSELPQELRRDFVLYGYVPVQGAALYVLVNKRVPRLYATATVPTDVPKTPAGFEWYDFDRAGEMLRLWDARANGKGVAE